MTDKHTDREAVWPRLNSTSTDAAAGPGLSEGLAAPSRSALTVDGPTVVSFSGGRTSAYMLRLLLDKYNGKLPPDCHVVFANTGKEDEKTLRFVADFVGNTTINYSGTAATNIGATTNTTSILGSVVYLNQSGTGSNSIGNIAGPAVNGIYGTNTLLGYTKINTSLSAATEIGNTSNTLTRFAHLTNLSTFLLLPS